MASKPADRERDHATIIRACKDAIQTVGINHPHILMVHARVRDLYEVREDLPFETLAIDADGSIKVHPNMVAKHREYLGFGITHELFHLILGHHKRAGDRDPETWGKAIDMVINTPLREAGLRCPDWALYLPPDYQGDRSAEEVYEWLRANPDRVPDRRPQDGDATGGKVGAGCKPLPGKARPGSGVPSPSPGDGASEPGDAPSPGPGDAGSGDSPIDWNQVRREAEAIAAQAGVGSSPLARMLAPRAPRADWRDVLRFGFVMGRTTHSRDYQTYSRPSRRSQITPFGTIVRPGWRGFDPTFGIVIDASGSMAREWLSQIVSEIEAQSALYPGSRFYVVVHTDRVVAEGWVRGGTSTFRDELTHMVQFTGGTDATEAYRRLREEHTHARFSVVTHFTDCELLTPTWPEAPEGARLIVGAFGSGATRPDTKLPEGAIHMPIEVPHG